MSNGVHSGILWKSNNLFGFCLVATVLFSLIPLGVFDLLSVTGDSAPQTISLPGRPKPASQSTPTPVQPNPSVKPQDLTIRQTVGTPSLWLNMGSESVSPNPTSSWTNQVVNPQIDELSQSNSQFQPTPSAPGAHFFPFNNLSTGNQFHNTLIFTGGEKKLEKPNVTSQNLINYDSFTAFIVARTSGNGAIISLGDSDTCGQYRFFISGSGAQIGENCNPGSRVSFTSSLADKPNQTQLVTLRVNGGNAQAFLDGKPNGTQTGFAIGGGGSSTLRVGSAPGEAAFDGDIAEILIYPTSLGTPSFEQVESYLALKYGISLDQTTPHNYYDSSGNIVYDPANHTNENGTIIGLQSDQGFGLINKQMITSQGNSILIPQSRTIDQLNPSFYQYDFFSQVNGGSNTETTDDVPPGVTKRLDQVWKLDTAGEMEDTIDMWFDLSGLSGVSSNILDFQIIESDSPDMRYGRAFYTSSALFPNGWYVPVTQFKSGKYYGLATKLGANETNLPTIYFADDFEVGPVETETYSVEISDDFEVAYLQYGWTGGSCDSTTSWEYSTSVFRPTYTFTGTLSNISKNGQYLCFRVTDLYGNFNFVRSVNPLNILNNDTEAPTGFFYDDFEANPGAVDNFGIQVADNVEITGIAWGWTGGGCDDSDNISFFYDQGFQGSPTVSLSSAMSNPFYNGQYLCVRVTDGNNNTTFFATTNPLNLGDISTDIEPPEITIVDDFELEAFDYDRYQIKATDNFALLTFSSVWTNGDCDNSTIFDLVTGVSSTNYDYSNFIFDPSFNAQYLCFRVTDANGNQAFARTVNPLKITATPSPRLAITGLTDPINFFNQSSMVVIGSCVYQEFTEITPTSIAFASEIGNSSNPLRFIELNDISVSVGDIEFLANCRSDNTFVLTVDPSSLPDGKVLVNISQHVNVELQTDSRVITKNVSPPEITINTVPLINIENQSEYTISGTCFSQRGNRMGIVVGDLRFELICNSDGTFSQTMDLSALPDGEIAFVVNEVFIGGQSIAASGVAIKNTGGIDQNDDGDNIPTEVENQAPNNGDGNDDGILDSTQSTVASLRIDDKFTTLVISEENPNCGDDLETAAKSTASIDFDKSVSWLTGLLDFKVGCSGKMDVMVFWYTDVDASKVKLVKCDDQNLVNGKCVLLDIPNSTNVADVIDGQKVIISEYSIIDNGFGDFDSTSEIIRDPVGLILSEETGVVFENTAETSSKALINTLIRTGGRDY